MVGRVGDVDAAIGWHREANLGRTGLYLADLAEANLAGANLTGVIGARFTGALNVPAKYLKD